MHLSHAGNPGAPHRQVLPFLLCNGEQNQAGGLNAAMSLAGCHCCSPLLAASPEVDNGESPKGLDYKLSWVCC